LLAKVGQMDRTIATFQRKRDWRILPSRIVLIHSIIFMNGLRRTTNILQVGGIKELTN